MAGIGTDTHPGLSILTPRLTLRSPVALLRRQLDRNVPGRQLHCHHPHLLQLSPPSGAVLSTTPIVPSHLRLQCLGHWGCSALGPTKGPAEALHPAMHTNGHDVPHVARCAAGKAAHGQHRVASRAPSDRRGGAVFKGAFGVPCSIQPWPSLEGHPSPPSSQRSKLIPRLTLPMHARTRHACTCG